MTIRISQANADTLSDMVLAHRCAVRNETKAERGSDSWHELAHITTLTQYGLDVALRQTDDDGEHKMTYIIEAYLCGEGAIKDTACVVMIRLEKLGYCDFTL